MSAASHDAVGILAIVCTFGLPFLGFVIWILTHYASTTIKAWQEVALKREMVARGYSVQEIVEVVTSKRGAKPKSKSALADVPPAKPIKHPAYSP